MSDDHLFERIRKLAVLMADEASKAYPLDYDAQKAMVRGASQLAPSMLHQLTDREEMASRPKW